MMTGSEIPQKGDDKMLGNIETLHASHTRCADGLPLTPDLRSWLASLLDRYLGHIRIMTTSVLILGMAVVGPPDAQAQMACGTRDSVVAKLGDKYGEVRRGGGLAGPTAIFEIWASEATGSWTILKTTPNGLTCIMAVGDGWHDDAGEAIASGDPV